MTYVAGLVGPRLRAGEVGVVDAIRTTILEHFLEQSLARLGRVGYSVGLRVQHDVGVA